VYSTATGALEPEGFDAWGNRFQANSPYSISADGNVVTFVGLIPTIPGTPDTPTPTQPDAYEAHIYARNRTDHTTVLVDRNGPNMSVDREPFNSYYNISADGRYVAFTCFCQFDYNGPTGMGHGGVYRTDLATGVVTEVDVNEAGVVANTDSRGATISPDGS